MYVSDGGSTVRLDCKILLAFPVICLVSSSWKTEKPGCLKLRAANREFVDIELDRISHSRHPM